MITKWWHNAVAYQIYPRSFQDTNADGIGDLRGIIRRLDYIQSLGVTMLWISPIYQSPMVDMGYDISNYQAIDPKFGTMQDFDELVQEAKKRNIRIIMDLVVNHTSDQHSWFQEALANPDSPYRNYYIFKTTPDGQVPNNWRAIFGGSTWTKVPGEANTYYFHTFAAQQPDLNWENPELRHAIYAMINWWLDKGIAGYRVDAITHLKKDLDWASLPADGEDGRVSVIEKGQNRPGLAFFLEELKANTFDKYDAVTIGEAYGVPDQDLPKFIGPNGYFSMIFDFSYLNIEMKDVNEWYRGTTNWTINDLKKVLFSSQHAIKNANGWAANVLENHDQPRVLSKLIRPKENQTPMAAKALAMMYYFLPGVPFIYQGQELGMKNFHRDHVNEFNDVSSLNNYHMALQNGYSEAEAMRLVNAKSRDNARTPMQWDDSKNAGFSEVKPWLALGNDRADINVVAEQSDPQSVLNFYRHLARIKQNPQFSDILMYGKFTVIHNLPDDVIGYQHTFNNHTMSIIVNLSDTIQTCPMPDGRVILHNGDDIASVEHQISLAPYQAIVMHQ